MRYAGINYFAFLKAAFLIISFFFIVSTLLQLNFPSLNNIENHIVSSMVERQLKLQPANDDIIKQGWVYYNLGQYDIAGTLMEKAFQTDDNISALYCLGLIDLKNGRTEEGIIKLERVQALSPDHIPTLMTLGKTYFEQRYFGRSRRIFEKVVQTDPTSEEARLWLGKTYVNLNDNDHAREILSTVTRGQEAMEATAILRNI